MRRLSWRPTCDYGEFYFVMLHKWLLSELWAGSQSDSVLLSCCVDCELRPRAQVREMQKVQIVMKVISSCGQVVWEIQHLRHFSSCFQRPVLRTSQVMLNNVRGLMTSVPPKSSLGYVVSAIDRLTHKLLATSTISRIASANWLRSKKQLKKKYSTCLFLSSEWCQICGTSEGRQSLLDSEIITKARINIQGPCRGRARYPAKLELLFFSFILICWLHSSRFSAERGASACWGSPNTRNFLATLPHIPKACIASNCDLCKARRMRTKVQPINAPTSSLTGH